MTILKVNQIVEATAGGAKYKTAKASITFNGTGTVAIRSSFNVSSLSDAGVGKYTASFGNVLSNATYFAGTSVCNESATWWDYLGLMYGGGQQSDVRTSSTCNIGAYTNSAYVDVPSLGLICVGDL